MSAEDQPNYLTVFMDCSQGKGHYLQRIYFLSENCTQ